MLRTAYKIAICSLIKVNSSFYQENIFTKVPLRQAVQNYKPNASFFIARYGLQISELLFSVGFVVKRKLHGSIPCTYKASIAKKQSQVIPIVPDSRSRYKI